jgi:hypothetical protein
MKKLTTIILLVVVTMSMVSCSSSWPTEKKQAYAFICLMREFYKHPEKINLVSIDAEDKNGKEIQVTNAKMLENWSNWKFLCIEIESTICGGKSFLVTYMKRSDGSMDFFSKVTYPTYFGWSSMTFSGWRSIPFYMATGSPYNLPQEQIDQKNLEAINAMKKLISDREVYSNL